MRCRREKLEVGLGIHGEPGLRRTKVEPVDNLVEEMTDYILKDLDYAGSDVAVLVNGLGATPYEELYIMYRKLSQIFRGAARNYQTLVCRRVRDLARDGRGVYHAAAPRRRAFRAARRARLLPDVFAQPRDAGRVLDDDRDLKYNFK